MTSYNNVKRIKQTNNVTDEYVSLVEYIVFEEKENNKYVVFKFRNNLEQFLYEVGFTVYQYTKDGELVEKSDIEYKNFRAGNYETFVPDKKFKANSLMETVSVELKYALFEKLIFKDNVTKPIIYNFNDYLNDVKAMEVREGLDEKLASLEEENDKKLKKQKAKEEKKQKKEAKKEYKGKVPRYQKRKERKLRRKKLIVEDITKQNKSKTTLVFSIISTVVVLSLTAMISFYFYRTSSTIKYDNVKYHINKETQELTVSGFVKGTKDICIHETVHGMNVVAVESRAFLNSEVENLTIFSNSNIEIKNSAFSNCTSLKNIAINGSALIRQGAFVGSESIISINAPLATIDAYAFGKLENLTALSFYKSSASKLNYLFYNTTMDDLNLSSLSVGFDFYSNPSFNSFINGYKGIVNNH